MIDLWELLESAAPRPQRAVNIAELDRSAMRQRTRARAFSGLVTVLAIAGLLTAGLVLSRGSDTGGLDTAATGESSGAGDGRPAASLVEVDYDLGGMTVHFVPEAFKATSAHVTVADVGPVAGDQSRVLSVTFERPSGRDLPLEERPDLSITFTETASPSAASLPDMTNSTEPWYAITPTTLQNRSSAVLAYNGRLSYGSVDAVLTPHLTVTVTGGPLSAEELLDVTNSIDTSTFQPCALGDGQWDDRPACKAT